MEKSDTDRPKSRPVMEKSESDRPKSRPVMEKSDPDRPKSRRNSGHNQDSLPKKKRISSESFSSESAQRIETKKRLGNDFVYLNHGYVGSMSNIGDTRLDMPHPPDRVVREQYWTCARWPSGQRFLALAVGLLVGTVIGLAVTVALRRPDENNLISGIFRSRTAPD